MDLVLGRSTVCAPFAHDTLDRSHRNEERRVGKALSPPMVIGIPCLLASGDRRVNKLEGRSRAVVRQALNIIAAFA